MYVSDKLKRVFHANPRTGSRAIRNAMMEVGACRVGGHHDSYKTYPQEHPWIIFCVIRDHREVFAGLLARPDHIPNWDAGEWTHHYTASRDNWRRDGRLYWRADFCNKVLRYPDVCIPGITTSVEPVGQTGNGKNWATILPSHIVHTIESDFGEEMKKLGFL